MSPDRGPRIAVRPEAKLRAVMEISQNLARARSRPKKCCPGFWKVFSRFFLKPIEGSWSSKTRRPVRCRSNHCGCGVTTRAESARMSMTILQAAMEKGRAILSEEPTLPAIYLLREREAVRIRSVMCAPLVAQTGESRLGRSRSIRRTMRCRLRKMTWRCSPASRPRRRCRSKTRKCTPPRSGSAITSATWISPRRCNSGFFPTNAPASRATTSSISTKLPSASAATSSIT